MAATGKTPILLYGSTTATNAPVAGNLTNSSDGCEIAINVADKNLFFKDSSNNVNTVPIRQSSASSNGWLSSTDWSTFNGKQAALGYTPVNKAGGDTMTGNLTAPVFTASSWMYVTPTTATSNALYRANNTGGTIYMGLDNSAGGLSGSPYSLVFYHSGNYPISFVNNGTEKLNIATTGDINVKTGNLVIGTSGKGIDFSATAGTGTSELLADYEEGTFTPTVVGTTSAGTATYSYALGRYTKIGRMVEIEIAMGWSSGSGTGDFKIGGLPFTPAFYGPISINRLDNVALTASNIATAYTSAGEATITLRQYPVGGGSDSAVAYDVAGDMIVGGTFYV